MSAVAINAVVVGQSECCLVICWDRGRPARNAPKVRRFCTFQSLNPFSRFALIAGGTPAVPTNHLRALGVIAWQAFIPPSPVRFPRVMYEDSGPGGPFYAAPIERSLYARLNDTLDSEKA